jgi:hypothetical protein
MTTADGSAKVRCVHCRVDVAVPEHYAHGDHIKCGSCGTKHKVVRGDRLRLVPADLGPVREALAQNEQLLARLEAELAHARGSFGLGANGVGIGLIYALYEVGLRGAPIDMDLLWGALGVALVTGALLELANWSFLAKRHRITRLSREVAEARAEGTRLRAIEREATRV